MSVTILEKLLEGFNALPKASKSKVTSALEILAQGHALYPMSLHTKYRVNDLSDEPLKVFHVESSLKLNRKDFFTFFKYPDFFFIPEISETVTQYTDPDKGIEVTDKVNKLLRNSVMMEELMTVLLCLANSSIDKLEILNLSSKEYRLNKPVQNIISELLKHINKTK